MPIIDAAVEVAAALAEQKAKENVGRTYTPNVWNHVSSSNVRAFMFDPDTRMLDVEFMSGRVHRYFNIDNEMVESFSVAGSPGSWVWQNIRGLPSERLR